MKRIAYEILTPEHLAPKDQIRLVPEEKLDPFERAELSNLRRGVNYLYYTADTPQNIESFTFRALYYQMVAYKEGWTFRPELYQAILLPPGDLLLGPEGTQTRILELKKESTGTNGVLKFPLSLEARVGFRIDEDTGYGKFLPTDEIDTLVDKVKPLFGN